MAVWMGTTAACAQCHNHKFDPISQREYFQLFAILNNTEDADRKDESPVLRLYSDEQRREQSELEARLAASEAVAAGSVNPSLQIQVAGAQAEVGLRGIQQVITV